MTYREENDIAETLVPVEAIARPEPSRRLVPGVLAALGLLFVIDQGRFLMEFLRVWVNEDATILWYAARDFGRGKFPQPTFYGQGYFTNFEALPAELLRWIGIGPSTAMTLAAALCVIGLWPVIALAAYRQGGRFSAVLALVVPLSISTEYLIATEAPGGRGAGVLTVMLAVLVATGGTRTDVRVTIISAFASLGVVWNLGMAIPVATIFAWLAMSLWREPRRLLWAATGCVPAVAFWMFNARFLAAHPDYNLHQGPVTTPSLKVLGRVLRRPTDYFGDLAPEIARHWSVAVVLGLTAVVAAVWSKRSVVVVPMIATVGTVLLVSSSPKVEDGADTVYVSYGRFFVGIPIAVWLLVWLTESTGSVSAARVTERSARRRLLGYAALGVAALASFVVRQSEFSDRTDQIATAARTSLVTPVSNATDLLGRCVALKDDARRHDVDLVVFRYDRTAAYGCGARWYGQLPTLFPQYDRRTWLMEDARETATSRLLVTEASEEWCEAQRPAVTRCTIVDDLGSALVETEPTQALVLISRLGIPIRPLAGGIQEASASATNPPLSTGASRVPTGGSRFVAVTPTRIVDTRTGLGADRIVPAGGQITFPVPARGGVPAAGVTAVAMNVTVTESSGVGFVQVLPTDRASIGSSSNLNIESVGQTISNLVVTPLGDGGQISVFVQGGGHVVVDVLGYWVASGASAAGRVVSIAPVRALDTRTGLGTVANPGDVVNCSNFATWSAANVYFWRYQPQFGDAAHLDPNHDLIPCESLPGNPGQAVRLADVNKGSAGGRVSFVLPSSLPSGQVAAVLLNVTVTRPEAAGFVQVLPAGAPEGQNGLWSNVNVTSGQTIANAAVIPASSQGLAVYTQARAHLIVDVVGYVTNSAAGVSGSGLFVPIAPARLRDTRTESTRPSADERVVVDPRGRAGIPITGVGAVLLNVTATAAAAPGFVQVTPARRATAIGESSSLNIERSGQTIANAVLTGLGPAGTFTMYTQGGTHLIADISGYITA